MTARQHHFLSQCYLRGFTNNGSKNSKLTVIDLSQKKHFETTPRNVGGVRDFNRIDIEGVDQNIIENSLADFESDAAISLKSVIEGANFTGKEKDTILTLIGLLAIRSPQMRENMRQFQAEIAERFMSISLATRENWESQIEQVRKSGGALSDNVTYEDMVRFHNEKPYTIEVTREHHIRVEMEMLQPVVSLLMKRDWSLIRADSDSGAIITTDRPVLLDYYEPDKVPPFFRNSPGFGLKNTFIYFPIAKNVSLLGKFSDESKSLQADRKLIATLNARMVYSANKQIYAPNLDFPLIGREGKIVSGKVLL
ncbi:DUF4238 domain-containing protein [Pseudomonas muyukensis]|uniref:DUF4238 domain-containing protein n=1 Tax=Pseudomonas muyukensis TaxID=2842357 RepID=A0ABX8M5L1_9PSED|nr:DUF4238 domain-containing protein [Pseudomonas muyukensis]QXH34259.1 DUF4238 domain-containing protein [Pseudomonas muyukensis]